MSVTVTQELTQQTVTVTGNPVENNVTVTVSNARGPAGTGGGGSNSVTSATTSDGTADLSISNVTTATAEVTGTLTANHIHGNLAGSVYAHVRAGEALLKGDPVYVSGFNNGTSTAEVMKADASNAAKMPAIGIMDANLAHNATGHMVVTGVITDLNTASYTVNAELYVAAGGGMTATPPTARAQPVARVERSNANNGAIIVKVNGLSASDATASTLVRRDASGGANFGGTVGMNIADVVDLRFEDFQAATGATFTYNDAAAASAHRFALNGGAATGDALFTAASPAAARTTLGLTTQFVYAVAGETITDADFSTPNHNERASVTTPGDDLELFLPVEANSFYEMAFQIGFSGYGNDGIKAQFNLPSILSFGSHGYGAVTGLNPITVATTSLSGTNIALPTVSTNNTPRAFSGVLVFAVGATAGNIKFQWSKNSTGASASLLRTQNSWMSLRKLGSI